MLNVFKYKLFFNCAGSYGYTVKQYSLEGELLKVLGTPGTPGSSLTPLQFGNVADVGFDRDGMMYIADGDGGLNNRLVELNTSKICDFSTVTERNDDQEST